MGPNEASGCLMIKFCPLTKSKGCTPSPEESLSEKYDILLEKEVSVWFFKITTKHILDQ